MFVFNLRNSVWVEIFISLLAESAGSKTGGEGSVFTVPE